MMVKRFRVREVKRSQARDIEGQDLLIEEKSDQTKITEDESKVFSQRIKIARLVDRNRVPTDQLLHIQIRVQVDLKLQMRAGVAMAQTKILQI